MDVGAFQGNQAFAEMHLSVSNQALKSIGRLVFDGCAVTNLAIGSVRELSVDSTAFRGVNSSNGLSVVTFTYKAPTNRAAVDNILLHNDLTQTKKVATLNLPLARRSSWEGYVTNVADITSADIKAAAEACNADGVWIAEDGMTYKAYVRYVGPPPPGMFLLIK